MPPQRQPAARCRQLPHQEKRFEKTKIVPTFRTKKGVRHPLNFNNGPMKKLFLWIAIGSMAFGCADDNGPNPTDVVGEIVGQWKLIYVHERSWDSYIADVSAKNIVFYFRPNGILEGTEGTALLAKGRHRYSFGEEMITIGEEDHETLIVKIGDLKWFYSFSDGQMNISQFDSDGGSLTFVKNEL